MRPALAHPAARGIDTVLPLTPASCATLRSTGVDYVVRYAYGRYAVTTGEVADILGSGLALMLCTPSRAPGWSPTGILGAEDAARTLSALIALRIPKGVTVWLDLEGVDGGAPAAYVDAWAMALVIAGYEAGLYVGAQCGLSAKQLYARPRITRYWRSGSRVPEPLPRGWCMLQLRPLDINYSGLRVDHDVIEMDYRAGLPAWVIA